MRTLLGGYRGEGYRSAEDVLRVVYAGGLAVYDEK